MAASRDWMFCPQSGYLLVLDGKQGRAHCPMSGYSKDLSGAPIGGAGRAPLGALPRRHRGLHALRH